MKRMLQMTIGLLLAVMLLAGCGLPDGIKIRPQGQGAGTVRYNDKGIDGGFLYQEWDNDVGSPTRTFGKLGTGRFSLTWASSDIGYNVFCGKGWGSAEGHSTTPGASSDRIIEYYGTFNPNRNGEDTSWCNSYLVFYGWANNHDIEYYVLESYGEFSPVSPDSGYTHLGELDSLGVHYEVYYRRQIQQPSPKGGGLYDFDQIYSVRAPRLLPGNVGGVIKLQRSR